MGRRRPRPFQLTIGPPGMESPRGAGYGIPRMPHGPGADPPTRTEPSGGGSHDPRVGGYEPFHSSPFIDLVGSIWVKRADGAPWIRFCVEARHANLSGFAHGGVLMTLADIVLAQGVRAHVEGPIRLATVSMTVDFVRAVAVGGWIHGRADVQRGSRQTLFARCSLTLEEQPVVLASGVYMVSPAA